MDAQLAWFESLCDTIRSTPQAATTALLQFRNSNEAHQLCMYVVSVSNRSDVKFQALLILKHTLVKHWATFSPQTLEEFRMFLWRNLITDGVETYVLNKLVQLFSLFVKKCWKGDSIEKRFDHFHLIETLAANGSDSPHGALVAARVLRAVVEELTSVDALDGGLTQGECSAVRRDFIAGADAPGLMLAANLSMSIFKRVNALTAPFDACVNHAGHKSDGLASTRVTINETQLYNLALLAGETAESIAAILRSCESGASSAMDGMSDSGSGRGTGLTDWGSGTQPGLVWLTAFVDRDMVAALFQLHHRLRGVLLALHFPSPTVTILSSAAPAATSPITPKAVSHALCSSLASIGGVLLAFASVDIAMIFPHLDNKLIFGEVLLSGALAYLEANVAAAPSMESAAESSCTLLFYMQDDGEYAMQEFAHGTDLVMRIVGNFKLSMLSRLPSFEKAIGVLARITNSITSYLILYCEFSSHCADANLSRWHARYEYLISVSEFLLAGPLADMMARCLDVWGLISGDAVLSRLSIALSDEESILPMTLLRGLREVCGQMFAQMYRCVMSVIIMDTMKSEDEELDVETDEIFERSTMLLIKGVADVGRMSISSSIGAVSSCMQRSVLRLDEILLQLNGPCEMDEKSLRVEITKQLEVQRLSADFLSFLLIESGDGYNTTNGVSGSSEVPLIPISVLEGCCENNRCSTVPGAGVVGDIEMLIIDSVKIVLQTLRQQCSYHQNLTGNNSACTLSGSQQAFLSSAISPLVQQGQLHFLSEFIWAYVDPGTDMYEVAPATLCPKLMDAMSIDGSFSEIFLDPVLQMALYCVTRLGRGNDDLEGVAINVLKCFSRLRRLPRLGGLPGLQQFFGLVRSTISPSVRHEDCGTVVLDPDCSLSVVNQALLCQHLGFISHELASSSNEDSVQMGEKYLAELYSALSSSADYCLRNIKGESSGSFKASTLIYCVASYRGFARCTVSLCPGVHPFLQMSLPSLYSAVVAVVASSLKNSDAITGSRLLSEWIGFLSDFAEATPLSSLPQASLKIALTVGRDTLLNMVFHHLRHLRPVYDAATKGCSGGVDDASLASLFVDILSGSLTYLDHIASSDLAVSFKVADNSSSASGALGIAEKSKKPCREDNFEIDALLCGTLLMLSSEVVTVEMIQYYKNVRDKYLSLVNLILRSHPLALGQQWLSLGAGLSFHGDAEAKLSIMGNLLSQVLCSVDSHDCNVGRLALLSLRSFGVFYARLSSELTVSPEYRALCSDLINKSANLFLHQGLSFLLGMMFPCKVSFDGSNDGNGISASALLRLKDRTDTFASTLLELVRIDSGQRLKLLLSEFLSSRVSMSGSLPESECTAALIGRSFEKLFSDRGVSLLQSSKLNERNFILNMRECLIELQTIGSAL